MKLIIFLLSSLFPLILNAQVDSIWQAEVSARYEVGLVPINKAKYTVNTLELSIKKMSLTLVPRISQKSIHSLSGIQLGSAAYKEYDWGYLDGTALYSNSSIFPTLTLKGNGHINIFQGYSATIGFQNYRYSDGNARSVLSIGSTYYLSSWMASYTLDINENFSHKLLVRRYLATASDYFQVGFYHGSFEDNNSTGSSDLIVSNTIQFAFNKTIWKELQIQFSLSSVGTNSVDDSSRFTNYTVGLKKSF